MADMAEADKERVEADQNDSTCKQMELSSNAGTENTLLKSWFGK